MQELSNGKTGLHIQIPRRLVGKNHLGRIEYGAGYHDTLLLSARQCGGIGPVDQSGKP